MSSYPVSRLRLLIYFFSASVVLILSDASTDRRSSQNYFFACYRISQSDNGSWSHYTVFKVLRSRLLGHFRAPLGDSFAIILLPALNVKCFFEKSLFFLFFDFFFYLLEFFRSFALFFPVFPLYIYFYIVQVFQFLPYFRRFARCF